MPALAERTYTRAKSTSLSLRISEQDKSLIDRAAAVSGQDRTEFMVASARKAAADALLDQRLFVLDDEQWAAFSAALDAPPRPNDRLKAMLNRRTPWEN